MMFHGCNHCKKSFKDKVKLVRHQLVHSHDKNYTCKTCERKFKSEAEEKVHQRVHLQGRDNTCITCKKVFVFKWELRNHEIEHIEGGQIGDQMKIQLLKIKNKYPADAHPCNDCTKSFAFKSQLDSHIFSHMNLSFNCVQCDKVYTRKKILTDICV